MGKVVKRMKRRTRQALESNIEKAKTKSAKAIACYELGLFHDNNDREAEAIPFYRNAIRSGLDEALRAKALAWLASSLYKTGKPEEALRCVNQAMRIADAELLKFLKKLQKRLGDYEGEIKS